MEGLTDDEVITQMSDDNMAKIMDLWAHTPDVLESVRRANKLMNVARTISGAIRAPHRAQPEPEAPLHAPARRAIKARKAAGAAVDRPASPLALGGVASVSSPADSEQDTEDEQDDDENDENESVSMAVAASTPTRGRATQRPEVSLAPTAHPPSH